MYATNPNTTSFASSTLVFGSERLRTRTRIHALVYVYTNRHTHVHLSHESWVTTTVKLDEFWESGGPRATPTLYICISPTRQRNQCVHDPFLPPTPRPPLWGDRVSWFTLGEARPKKREVGAGLKLSKQRVYWRNDVGLKDIYPGRNLGNEFDQGRRPYEKRFRTDTCRIRRKFWVVSRVRSVFGCLGRERKGQSTRRMWKERVESHNRTS